LQRFLRIPEFIIFRSVPESPLPANHLLDIAPIDEKLFNVDDCDVQTVASRAKARHFPYDHPLMMKLNVMCGFVLQNSAIGLTGVRFWGTSPTVDVIIDLS
jgi:hypothetical protein